MNFHVWAIQEGLIHWYKSWKLLVNSGLQIVGLCQILHMVTCGSIDASMVHYITNVLLPLCPVDSSGV